MTAGQRLSVQRRAKDAGVDVAFDPRAHDAVRLYVYAFEMGMTAEIAAALDEKAKDAARGLRLPYAHVGVVLDASASMAGSKEQPLRPMATALAIRDVLRHAAPRVEIAIAGGTVEGDLVRPRGATSLAGALLDVIERGLPDVEAAFVISDGYENRPAGRLAEVVAALRSMNVRTPIYHLDPVFAAASRGVRSLSPDVVTMPANGPTGLGLAFVRAMLAADPARGMNALMAAARPLLTA
jgi:hypothetical protein